MNEQFDPATRSRIRALHSYTLALEHGDLGTVANVLQDAEQDAVLERMLLELHDASLETAQSIHVNDVLPLYSLLKSRPGKQFEEETEKADLNDRFPLPQHSSQSKRQRYSRLTRIFQSLAAVLVIGALISGFALLLARHPVSTGSNNTVSIVSPTHATITSLAVSDGTAYLAGSDKLLTARRGIDGHLLWSQSLPSNSPFLIAAGSILYDAFDENTSAIVEARQGSDGHLLWRKQLPRLGPIPLRIGGDTLYVNTGRGLVFALNIADGHILWQFASGQGEPMDGFLYAATGYVVVFSSDQIAHVLNAQNGSQVLSYPSLAGEWWPVIVNGTIYIHGQDGFFRSYRLSDGVLLWTSQEIASLSDPWTLEQGIIYINTRDTLVALNSQTGLLLWQRLAGNSSIIAGPIVQDNQVSVIIDSGSVVAFHTNGSPMGTHQLEHFAFGTFYTDLLYPDGIFLIGTNILTIDTWQSSSGKYLWHYTASAHIFWEPQTDNGLIFIRKLDGTMDVLNVNTGKVLWRYLL